MQVNGVKGRSWLFHLKSLDFINGASPEYMHSTLIGVTKHLISLWIERCHGSAFDIHTERAVLDDRIDTDQVPSEIRRKPCKISDVKHWKGTKQLNFSAW